MSALTSDRIGIVAAVITALSWGLTGIFVRLIDDLSSEGILFCRLFFSYIALQIFAVFYDKFRNQILLDYKIRITWKLAFLQFMYFSFATYAFNYAPVSDVALLISTSPIFILVIHYFINSNIAAKDLVGVALSLLGVAIIIFGGHSESGADQTWPLRIVGDILALCAALSIGLYALYYKTATEKNKHPSAFSVALVACFVGSVISSFFLSTADLNLEEEIISLPLIGLALISTAIPAITYALSSSRLPPVVTTTIRMLTPVFASVLSYLILSEVPTVWIIPGGALVIFGSYVITMRNIKREKG